MPLERMRELGAVPAVRRATGEVLLVEADTGWVWAAPQLPRSAICGASFAAKRGGLWCLASLEV
jgi:hypothetical protein